MLVNRSRTKTDKETIVKSQSSIVKTIPTYN